MWGPVQAGQEWRKGLRAGGAAGASGDATHDEYLRLLAGEGDALGKLLDGEQAKLDKWRDGLHAGGLTRRVKGLGVTPNPL